MTRKIPKWESELWSYVSSGDGTHCPLYSCCQKRKECGWCVDEHKEEISQMLEDRQLDTARYDFVGAEGERLGRPFLLVEKLARKYLLQGQVHGPPVPLALISLCDTECPVEIRSISLKTYHGAIWRLKDRWIIQLKAGDTSAMKRHTVFHEAFHILAHRTSVPVFRKRGVEGGYFNELLSDYFAICILMPREWIREKWAEVKDVNRMAKIFDVPMVAMWLRLRQLGIV